LGESIRPLKGEKDAKGLSTSPFLAINAKGGKVLSPKQKVCTTISNFRNEVLIGNFQLVLISIYVFTNWYQLVSISKPSWKLRGEFHSGEFYLVKGKTFETEREILNLENTS
jgi:hypothetical protein